MGEISERPVTPHQVRWWWRLHQAVPDMENLIVATGHAMLGMTMGPVTGKAVSEIVVGDHNSTDLMPLKFGRF